MRTAAELDRLLAEAGVVCAPVNTAADIVADPHFRERELVIDVDDEVHGELAMPGVVPRLDGTPGGVRQAARWTVGADTAEVLRELGVDAGRLGQMTARGAAIAPAEHGASRR